MECAEGRIVMLLTSAFLCGVLVTGYTMLCCLCWNRRNSNEPLRLTA